MSRATAAEFEAIRAQRPDRLDRPVMIQLPARCVECGSALFAVFADPGAAGDLVAGLGGDPGQARGLEWPVVVHCGGGSEPRVVEAEFAINALRYGRAAP